MTLTPFEEALKLTDNVAPVELEFRLYYDTETNLPLFYSMEEQQGDYINISKEEFAECRYDIIIKDSKICKVTHLSIGKLVPTHFGYGTTKDDITIVGNEQNWNMKTYD